MSKTNLNVNRENKSSYTQSGGYNNSGGMAGYKTYADIYPTVGSSVVITRSSGSTPDFGTKRQPSPLPVLGFSYASTITMGESGSESHFDYYLRPQDYGYNSSMTTGTRGGISVPGIRTAKQSELDQMEAEANNQLLNKIKGMTINLGQAMGERMQTANLLASTATKIAKAAFALRKGNFAAAADHLGVISPKRAKSRFGKSYARQQTDAVANAWLELQYGWKPLLSDVYGACEALAKKHDTRIIQRAMVNKQYNESLDYRRSSKVGELTSYQMGQGGLKINIRKGVTYASPNKPLSTMAQLGISNPLLLAWELLPFSFVADWFLPVGSFLSTLDATSGLEFVTGYSTTYQSVTFVGTAGMYGRSYGRNDEARWCGSQNIIRVTRIALPGFPSPCRPYFKDPFSMVHVANALALLNNLRRK